MVDKVKKFFTDHSITAHSVAGLFVVGIMLYAQVPEFKHIVDAGYVWYQTKMPHGVQTVVATGVAVYVWYRNNKSKIAIVAQAAQIQNGK